MLDLHIVTVNYKTKEVLVAMLESLFLDLKSCSYAVAVTVVDNSQNSDGIKEALAQTFPKVVYKDAGNNLGFGRANNVGFREREARYYLALNPDTLLQEGANTITRMIQFLDAHPKIGAIGPKLVNVDGTLQYACYRFDLPSICVKPLKYVPQGHRIGRIRTLIDRLHMADFDHNSTRPVDWVLGAALMVRREVVEEVGFFDERYFMYMEDADWCRAMWEKGWPVYYVHDIIMTHRYARDSARIAGPVASMLKNKLARIHVMSWLRFLWKWRRAHRFYGHRS